MRLVLQEVSAVPSGDTWHLTDHHSLPMEFLVCHTLEAIAVGDWVWQTRLNVLLLTAASRIVESRLLHISVASMLATWYKRYRKAFLVKLRRSEMELVYLRAHKQGANKMPNWLILRAPQHPSCRLVHLAVLYHCAGEGHRPSGATLAFQDGSGTAQHTVVTSRGFGPPLHP